MIPSHPSVTLRTQPPHTSAPPLHQVYKLGEGLRSLHRKLKANWKVLSNQGETGITQETLSQVRAKTC